MCLCARFSDSCQRGWRLLYILTAFHHCSEVLKPFLLKYLGQASVSAGVQYQGTHTHTCTHSQLTVHNRLTMCHVNKTGIAKACEQNLRKTFQYGGRIVPPNSMELKAMMVSAKLDTVYLYLIQFCQFIEK